MATIKGKVARDDTPRPLSKQGGGDSKKVPPTKAKSAKSPVKTVLVLLSIGVVFVGVFLALDGKKAVKHALNSYFKSKDSKDVSHDDTNEKEQEQVKLNADLDWSLSPLSGFPFLTDEQIKYVDGGKSYLVILGHVFDVSSSSSYNPGSGYHGFIGRDATRAFISGQFDNDGLISELDGLKPADFQGLADWLKFYFKTYPFIGYHVARFFDAEQTATSAYKHFLEMLDVAAEQKKAQEAVQKEFPNCNVEWSDKDGTNVWCSKQSGGVERDFVGYPAMFKESPDKETRCACVRESQLQDPRIKLYPGCDHKKHRCDRIDN